MQGAIHIMLRLDAQPKMNKPLEKKIEPTILQVLSTLWFRCMEDIMILTWGAVEPQARLCDHWQRNECGRIAD